MDGQEWIVVIEDDPNIADLVALYLRNEGYAVVTAGDAAAGDAAVERTPPVLAVVDIGLPGEENGLDVTRRLVGKRIPVILLTARDDEVDRIVGLELGADDYVTKPFSPRELVARVKAVLRRSHAVAPAAVEVIEAGGLRIDLARHEVSVAGSPVALTAREFDLLAYLASNRGLALTRRQVLDGAWGVDWVGDERTVDVHVRQLRRKLGEALPLSTVRGMGYRFA